MMFYFLRKFFCLHKFYYHCYKKYTDGNVLHIVAGDCIKCFKSKTVSKFDDTHIENEMQAQNLAKNLNNAVYYCRLYKDN